LGNMKYLIGTILIIIIIYWAWIIQVCESIDKLTP